MTVTFDDAYFVRQLHNKKKAEAAEKIEAWTQADTAKLLGKSQTYVSNYLNKWDFVGLKLEHYSNELIYFVAVNSYERQDFCVKIGYSSIYTFKKRLIQIQTGSPDKLKLLLVIPGSRAVEKQLHNKYISRWYQGEWFSFSEDMMLETGSGKPLPFTIEDFTESSL